MCPLSVEHSQERVAAQEGHNTAAGSSASSYRQQHACSTHACNRAAEQIDLFQMKGCHACGEVRQRRQQSQWGTSHRARSGDPTPHAYCYIKLDNPVAYALLKASSLSTLLRDVMCSPEILVQKR
jgi:hypothetical protein